MSEVRLSDAREALDVARIHAWLAASYWSPGIERALVERAIAGSHCVGAYVDGDQIGLARAISDRATFAWISDVIVAEDHRGRGIGRRLVRWFLDHPDYAGLRRVGLVTLDAHGVYAPLGFHPPLRPENYMERLGPGYAEMLGRLR